MQACFASYQSSPASPKNGKCLSRRFVQEEFEAYRTTAEAMTESKDAELAKALESKIALRQQLAELQSRQKEVCLQILHSSQSCLKAQSPSHPLDVLSLCYHELASLKPPEKESFKGGL